MGTLAPRLGCFRGRLGRNGRRFGRLQQIEWLLEIEPLVEEIGRLFRRVRGGCTTPSLFRNRWRHRRLWRRSRSFRPAAPQGLVPRAAARAPMARAADRARWRGCPSPLPETARWPMIARDERHGAGVRGAEAAGLPGERVAAAPPLGAASPLNRKPTSPNGWASSDLSCSLTAAERCGPHAPDWWKTMPRASPTPLNCRLPRLACPTVLSALLDKPAVAPGPTDKACRSTRP